MAPVRNWSRFRRDWRKVLDPLGIGEFHMTDFIAGERDFKAWKDKPERQMQVVKRLIAVIKRHSHFSPATTILLRDWNVLNEKYRLKECRATPYAIASVGVINKSIQWIRKEHPHEALREFVFEHGDRGQGDLMFIMDQVRKRAPELAGIFPQFKPKSLEPLQACDLAAWEQRY